MKNYNFVSIFLGIGYAIIGIFVFVNKAFFVQLEPVYANLLGLVFILYGTFRTFRAIKTLNRKE